MLNDPSQSESRTDFCMGTSACELKQIRDVETPKLVILCSF